MKLNSKMQHYLDGLASTELRTNNYNINLNGVKEVVFPEFIEWDGCVLLKQEKNDPLPHQFSPNQFIPDRTAFEADYNHIHLNDIFDEILQPNQIFYLSTKIIDVWAAVLSRQFKSRYRFILILSFDSDEVVLRFYTVRDNETPWLDTSALESYLDGLLLIEI
ncbi:hypothetical protein [Paenibacillus alvei]|uniref:hypothetical protein n=1 Tax=Paenibacillus alvei TaxID=44250 RepID=UPI0003869578|nr:hypothetical protein [Paenibacillus alvei]EPY14884.1 hypothetical protein PAAL66ix_00155 [Paenibacillus alvei A6-6i-x]